MRKKLVLIGCLIALLVGVGIGYIVYLNFPALTEEKKEKSDNTQSTTDAIVVDSEDDEYLYHIKVFSTAIDDEYSACDIKIDLEYNIYLAKLESITSTVSEDDYELVATLNNEDSNFLEECLNSDLFTHELGTSMDINEFFSYYIVNYNTNKVLYSTDDIDTEVNTLVLSLAQGNISSFDDDKLDKIKNNGYNEIDINNNYVQELYDLVTIDADDNGVSENYIEEKITNSYTINIALLSGRVEYEERNISYEWNDVYSGNTKIYSNSSLDSVIKSIFGDEAEYDITQYSFYYYDDILGYENGGCNDRFWYSEEYNSITSLMGEGCGISVYTIRDLAYAYEKDDKLILVERALFSYASYILYRGYNGLLIDLFPYGNDSLLNMDSSDILDAYSNYVTYYSYTFTKNNDGTYYYTSFDRLN